MCLREEKKKKKGRKIVKKKKKKKMRCNCKIVRADFDLVCRGGKSS